MVLDNLRNKIKEGITFHHHHVSFAIIFIILLLVVIILLIRPAFLGYRLSSEFGELGTSPSEILKQIESTKSDLLISKTNLETSQGLNSQYLADVTKEKNSTLVCLEEQRKIKSQFEQLDNAYQFNVSQINAEKSKLQSELASTKVSYELILKNAANNICCKTKVDNPAIDSYIIANDRISCAVGEQTKIAC